LIALALKADAFFILLSGHFSFNGQWQQQLFVNFYSFAERVKN
jgi:hypothetical protein